MIVHATTVAVDGRAMMIMGAAGTGKSGLALEMMGLGAVLVADDQTQLERLGTQIVASCRGPIRDLIEARGVGLLRAPSLQQVPLALCVDLDRIETDRLPPQRKVTFLERPFDLVLGSPHRHFCSALMQYMRQGRVE